MRSIIVTAALAMSLAMSGTAFADAGLKFPNDNAACVGARLGAQQHGSGERARCRAFIRDFAHGRVGPGDQTKWVQGGVTLRRCRRSRSS